MMPSGTDFLLDVIAALAFGLAAVWLLSNYLQRSHRLFTLLCVLPALAGFSALTFVSRQGGSLMNVETLQIGIVLAVGVLASAVALCLAGLICRSRYRPLANYLWLFLSLVVAWLVIAFPLFLFALVTSGGKIPWSEFFVPILAVATGNFAVLLPFLILSSASPFFRERLKALLHVKSETAAPLNRPSPDAAGANLNFSDQNYRSNKRQHYDTETDSGRNGCWLARRSRQSEQWLEYHTGTEGRAYHQMELTTNPPPGIALPKLNASPYFARWLTPMDPAGGRWLCFDRTRKSGPYDRLFIDSNGNGRLDDKTPVQARLDSYSAFFPPAPVVFKGEDGPITYHLMFRFYQYENSARAIAGSRPAAGMKAMVNFDGVKKRIQLIDGNVNGTFNDLAPNPYDSDRVQVDGDKIGERFLGRMLEVDGKFFRIEVARDGAFVKVQKAENVTLGRVRVPENISEFAAFGENGHFVRKPANGEFTLPAGNYRIFRWTINRKDEKGVPWTLSGYSFPDTAAFEVAADKTDALEIGEPVQAVLKADPQPNRQIRVQPQLCRPSEGIH